MTFMRTISSTLLRLPLVLILLLIADRLPAGEAHPSFSGWNGGVISTGTPYDQMTPAEHDACGAWWSGF